MNVVIHQLNERCWVIQGEEYRKTGDPFRELHISYHNGDHYSSVRRIGDPDDGPAWLFNNQHKVLILYNEKMYGKLKKCILKLYLKRRRYIQTCIIKSY